MTGGSDLIGRRAVLTGATGFIGRRLVRALRRCGVAVTALVRAPEGVGEADDAIVLELLDRDAVARALRGARPDYVVHLARLQGDPSAVWGGYEANVRAAINLLEASRTVSGLRRFVSLGSCEEYGPIDVPFQEFEQERPLTDYGLAKLAVTQLLRAASFSGFPAVVLRPTVVYGPGQKPLMFVPSLIASLLAGQPFPMSAGEQSRDLVFVDDLVEAILAALLERDVVGAVINVSSAEPIRILDLAKLVARLIGGSTQKLLEPGRLPYPPEGAMNYYASNEHALSLLRWRPAVALEDGLRRTIDDFRSSAA
jgi:UDP-glucose 4-epimerase